MPLVQQGKGYALEPSLDEDLWGTPLYFKEHEKPLIKEKYNQSQRVLLLLRLNLHVEGILVVIQLKSTVTDLSQHLEQTTILTLGICSSRKFYCLSLSLFKTTLIRKHFLILKQTSVIYKSPLCSYICPVKLHRISLILLPFQSSTEISMQLSYHFLFFCTPFPAVPCVLHGIYSPVPYLIRPFTTLATSLWTQSIY